MSRTVRNLAPSLFGALAWVLLWAAPAPAQNAEGLFVTVPNPITTDALERIQKQVDTRIHGESRRVQTVVFDFNPQDKDAGTPVFGPCQDLGAYIAKLTKAEDFPDRD